ncbi:MAG: pseudouridine-5'-phosphate glycosidase [Rickettsiales bacterium]
MQHIFEYSTEVKHALQQKKPVLALESTLITHGLPYPQNIETAEIIENIIREKNVTPATIAIMNGKIKIGLTNAELESLVHDNNVYKASRRDLAYLLNKKCSAGTTVAATLFCAEAAGIKVFATGGIGGVHRGAHYDVSADLFELAKTPIAVVCAGAKAILDLPKTLEFLESVSVPVIGYRTDTLPAFYSTTTPYELSVRIDDISELVQLLRTHWQLGMNSGVLITTPIPKENEIPAAVIEPVIQDALRQAEDQCITGKAVTPFLLNKVSQITKGKSLTANIHLIQNNVRLGADLAYALNNT